MGAKPPAPSGAERPLLRSHNGPADDQVGSKVGLGRTGQNRIDFAGSAQLGVCEILTNNACSLLLTRDDCTLPQISDYPTHCPTCSHCRFAKRWAVSDIYRLLRWAPLSSSGQRR